MRNMYANAGLQTTRELRPSIPVRGELSGGCHKPLDCFGMLMYSASLAASATHRRCCGSTGKRRRTLRSREMPLPSTGTRCRRWRRACRSGKAPRPTVRSLHTST